MKNTAVSIHVQILECTYVFISLGYTPRSGITESFGNFVFNFLRNCQNVFQNNRHRVYLLTSNVELQFLSVFVDICYFPFLYSALLSECEMVSHCGFDMHFPEDWWCWASLHGLIGPLYVIFGAMSIQIRHPFLNWDIYHFIVEL